MAAIKEKATLLLVLDLRLRRCRKGVTAIASAVSSEPSSAAALESVLLDGNAVVLTDSGTSSSALPKSSVLLEG